MYVPYFETKNFSISLSERPSTNWSRMNSRISFANSESELSMFSFWHTRQRMFELNFLALSSNWELPKISEGSTAKARDAIKKANKIKKKYFKFFYTVDLFLCEVKDRRLTNPPNAINVTPNQIKEIKGLIYVLTTQAFPSNLFPRTM